LSNVKPIKKGYPIYETIRTLIEVYDGNYVYVLVNQPAYVLSKEVVLPHLCNTVQGVS